MSETKTQPEETAQAETTSEPMSFASALTSYLEIDTQEIDAKEFEELLEFFKSMTEDDKTAWKKELEGHGYKLLSPEDTR